ALLNRGRESYLRSRGLPPGSLGVRASLRAIVDRNFYRRQLERHGPVFKTAQFHNGVVCVAGLDRGRELLTRHREALAPPPLALSDAIPRGFLRYMSVADHERYSPLFRAAFSEPVFDAHRDFAREQAVAGLERLARGGGEAGGQPAEAVRSYVGTTLTRIFFGRAFSADDARRIEHLVERARGEDAAGGASRELRRTVADFAHLLVAATRSAGADSGPSVWSRLVAASPELVDDATVHGNLFALWVAAEDSVRGVLVWMARFLAADPRWIEGLRERAARGDRGEDVGRAGGERDLATRLVLETLRLAQSEYVYRRVLEPIEVDGFRVPAGWMVRILVAESHRSDPPFGHPDRFDPDRHLGSSLGPSEFAPLGLDHHTCLGAGLTLWMGRVFARAAARYDWQIVADGPPQRGNRHWMHWAPSSELRVRLVPVGAGLTPSAAVAAGASVPAAEAVERGFRTGAGGSTPPGP
ncbi:MAG: cytochrome P450, partial [Thermoanaerobaculia bacterium]|nr:cytochrome P450 [Thermoanaerobaculia bacterium]